jgi:hypothetical protein
LIDGIVLLLGAIGAARVLNHQGFVNAAESQSTPRRCNCAPYSVVAVPSVSFLQRTTPLAGMSQGFLLLIRSVPHRRALECTSNFERVLSEIRLEIA